MTVVAWRGNILAADKQQTGGDAKVPTRKIWRRSLPGFDDVAVAITGWEDSGSLMIDWYLRGAHREEFPEGQRQERWSRLIVLHPQEGCFFYEQSPFKIEVYGEYMAWGCGLEAALGAMYVGASAIQAVEAANQHVERCGFGVDHVEVQLRR